MSCSESEEEFVMTRGNKPYEFEPMRMNIREPSPDNSEEEDEEDDESGEAPQEAHGAQRVGNSDW